MQKVWKTFTTYQLAKKMGWKRILVLTWVPSVENEWKAELKNHADFTDGNLLVSLKHMKKFLNQNPYASFILSRYKTS